MEAKVTFKPLTKKRYRIYINGVLIEGKEGITKHPKDYALAHCKKRQTVRQQLEENEKRKEAMLRKTRSWAERDFSESSWLDW